MRYLRVAPTAHDFGLGFYWLQTGSPDGAVTNYFALN